MNNIRIRLLYSTIPFLILFSSFFILDFLHQINPDPIDSEWTSRQLILGLFIFISFSFIPRFLKLSLNREFPYFHFSLSHHAPSHRSDHELRISNQWLCTGCVGTSFSLILGNSLLITYFLYGSSLNSKISHPLFFLGILMILITYSRYIIFLSPFIRLIQHSFLFIGLATLITAIDIYYKSALFLSLLIPVWALFLLFRIKLSKLSH